jgi:hypothetical protein
MSGPSCACVAARLPSAPHMRPVTTCLRPPPAGRSRELYSVASSTGASSSGQRAEAAVAGADSHQVCPCCRHAAPLNLSSALPRHPSAQQVAYARVAPALRVLPLAPRAQVPVALSSFGGKHMHLFLRKHADRLREDVLQSDEDEGQGVCGGGGEAGGPEAGWPLQRSSLARQPKPNLPESSSHLCPGRAPPRLLAAGKGSLWSKVSSWTGGSGVAAPAVEGEERETIHVFTVASGHMCVMGGAGWPLQRSSLARQPKPNLPESSSHLCPGRAPPRLLAQLQV